MPTSAIQNPVLLFDGVCNMCNAGVNFLLDHEAAGASDATGASNARLLFAPLQSEFARSMFLSQSKTQVDMTAAILIENGRWYHGSTAMLRAAWYLRWPWRALWMLVAIPPPVRDCVYQWIAANRYQWFGKSEACRLPTPETAARFLS